MERKLDGSANQEGKDSELHQYSIKIWEEDEDCLSFMAKRIEEIPGLLKVSAGGSSCCIFRVPQPLVSVDQNAYRPEIVSIGPYHHARYHLEVIEEHKWRFLGSLVTRTKKIGLELDDYFQAIKQLEVEARECYSETISLSSKNFVQMMVLDGCFIVELLRKVEGIVAADVDDPIFKMPWVMPVLRRDLLKLENQLPFFILQRLFNLSRAQEGDDDVSLTMLALKFFNTAVWRPIEVLERYSDVYSKHLLDLYRSSFLPFTQEKPPIYNPPTRLIQCATKLRASGIKFKPRKSTDTFLDIEFRNQVLEIPPITINDFTSCSFLNAIAFEQCHQHCSKHVTSYAVFMDCLINSSSDVGFLYDDKVIANFSGNEHHVASFFNKLGKYIAHDVGNCYLSKQIEAVEKYYRSRWGTMMRIYFHTPWSFMSASSACILLLLTLAQTFFTIFPFIRRSS